MWVLIITNGSRGDCQPYVILAKGLAAKGHRVTLAVEAVHSPLIDSLLPQAQQGSGDGKVEVLGLRGDFGAMQKTETWQSLIAKRDLYSLLFAIQEWTSKEFLFNARAIILALLKDPSQKPDAMLCNLTVWLTAIPLAEGFGIPLIAAPLLPPSLPNDAHPPSLMYPRPLPLAPINYLACLAAYEILLATVMPMASPLRIIQHESGAPIVDLRQCLYRFLALPQALCYPSFLFPSPLSWLLNKEVSIAPCGALVDRSGDLLQGVEDDGNVKELKAFLDAGGEDDKPVFISWGSIMSFRPDLARLAIGALAATGRRGVIQGGWEGISSTQLDLKADASLITYAKSRVFEIRGSIPHSWLFPRCSIIVHHGGSGTTAAALYAGVPQVVLPVLADQPFWAVRVGVTGLGVRHLISAYDVTVEGLAMMIEEVSKEEYRVKAVAAREEAMKEDGVGNAIDVIERQASRGGEVFWREVRERVKRQQERRVLRARILLGTIALCAGGLIVYVTVVVTRGRRTRSAA